MKNTGKVFEQNWKASCPAWLFTYKPPDAAQSFNMANNLRFSQRSPCDYIMYNGKTGILYSLELKTFENSCSFERCKEDNGIIHYHQIESLKKLNTYENIISGFVLDFRKTDTTYFLFIDDFCRLSEMITKKSFNEKDMIEYCNPIKIKKRKLKVNYRYDVEKFLHDTACTLTK